MYETGAMYVTDQDDFLNQVVEVETDFKPEELLRICKQLEDELGREKTIRFGPRSIDIDILIYGDVSLKTETLELPHPRMCERDFVLVPLREIAPDILLA
ncbi:MAG: 2-amino-4-hydroxy-6-hydroxymethyldihydropteridine diphosphokinase [Candidatus Peribacteria bacterium]|nr:MAG: 2-amino-4-hydroxy-6-hydroxymethyldihydropteridine diphosphokinase [Candidatus Peribacteria bacterium]